MKVALVTTWGVPCGVAEYARQLCVGLRAAGHEVHPLATDEEATDPRDRVWPRNGDLAPLVFAADAIRPDVIHIQHEFGLFQDASAFLRVLPELRKIAPVVVTFHTVSTVGDRGTFYRGVLSSIDAVIVHTSRGACSLLSHPLPDPPIVDRVAHGVDVAQTRPDRRRVEAVFGVPATGVLAVTAGFVGATKAIPETLTVLTRLIQRGVLPDDFRYVVLGRGVDDVLEWAKHIVSDTGSAANVFLIDRYATQQERSLLLASADFGILHRWSTPYSASGQVADALGHALPLLVRDVAIHDDVGDEWAVRFSTDDELDMAVRALTASPLQRAYMRNAARHCAQGRTWTNHATLTERIYGRALARRKDAR